MFRVSKRLLLLIGAATMIVLTDRLIWGVVGTKISTVNVAKPHKIMN